MEILIKELPALEVAYFRRVGSYFEPQAHWGNLMEWATENELLPPAQHVIGISLDNPEIVAPEKCRHDACVTIPHNFDKSSDTDVQFRVLPGGKYAVYSFYDAVHHLNAAYRYMYNDWWREDNYEIDYDRHALEFNMNNPFEDPEGKAKVDLYVPIL